LHPFVTSAALSHGCHPETRQHELISIENGTLHPDLGTQTGVFFSRRINISLAQEVIGRHHFVMDGRLQREQFPTDRAAMLPRISQ